MTPARPKSLLLQPSQGRGVDLAGLFIWNFTEEGWAYWNALACGNGLGGR